MLLERKVAVVTGGARGIGAAISRLFVEEGAWVVVADRRDDEGLELVGELNAARPRSAHFAHLDVAIEDEWRAAIADAEATFGQIDILVNGWTDDDYDAAYGKYPLGRMAEAREVAVVALFLASDKASFCTGGDFVVDGGSRSGNRRIERRIM